MVVNFEVLDFFCGSSGCVLWLCALNVSLWLCAVIVCCGCVLWMCLCGCVFGLVVVCWGTLPSNARG